MNVNFYMLENHLNQKLSVLNEDLHFFKNILKDCKKENQRELSSDVPNYHLIENSVEELEIAIKVLKAALADNYTVKNRSLMDRFNNLHKVSEVNDAL